MSEATKVDKLFSSLFPDFSESLRLHAKELFCAGVRAGQSENIKGVCCGVCRDGSESGDKCLLPDCSCGHGIGHREFQGDPTDLPITLTVGKLMNWLSGFHGEEQVKLRGLIESEEGHGSIQIGTNGIDNY